MKILLLAGEESGMMYRERIAAKVGGLCPGAEIRGYGDYGFNTGDLAVMGILAVLRRIFFFMRVRRTMERAIDEWRPDVVCTVDYPGMNLRLAAYAKARGIRTVHVVCPQVWAWKRGRIPKIEAALDRLCCFFPFEPALFRPGFAEFVGHPLALEMAKEGVERCGEETVRGEPGGKLLAVLPGSRIDEIRHHMPTLLAAVSLLSGEVAGLRIVIPAANERARAAIVAQIERFRKNGHGDGRAAVAEAVSVRDGGARELLRTADAAVVASGTATLEAALAGCPTVLVYKVDPVFAFIARRVITGVRHIGLANIIAEKSGAPCPMPELLQEDFTAEAVAERLKAWLTDKAANAAARAALADATGLLRAEGDPVSTIARTLCKEERRC